jgi:hypothetical protein
MAQAPYHNMRWPFGSCHRTALYFGLVTCIAAIRPIGIKVRTQADMRPSADITRTCASSCRRARVMRDTLSSNSARLPPDSRWISTAITR